MAGTTETILNKIFLVARDGVEKRLRFSNKTKLTVDPVPVISRVPRLIILKWDIWNSIQENFMWPGTG
ncbi:MAG: hypothetical protein EBQ98_03760 [Actinobacteria bacterium]|nr:hypothetical protein [Actinomycetota bacterium]